MKNSKFFTIGLLTCLFLLSAAFVSAKMPNFAGTWTLNEVKSPMPENGFRMGSTKITATQDELKLSTERTYKGQNGEDMTSKEVYTFDGKECESLFFQTMKRKSTATWSADGKVLTINSVTLFERDGETMEMKSYETWKLSADSNELTMESSITTPNGDMKSTCVYDKAK